MTIQYNFNTRPMSPGESRNFTLTSSTPAKLQIKCFITSPPPGYRPCTECGTYSLQQGQSIQIEASQYLFSRARGGLEIIIKDLDGDVIRIQLKVTTEDPESASEAVFYVGTK